MEKVNQSTNKIRIKEKMAYGFGDFGCNIIYTAMTTYLMFYYTDYAQVSAVAVGGIMLISRILDGISDLIMGYIVDHTKSKNGKARPWILRMAIPFAISGVFLFSVPTNWGEHAKLVYVFVTYNLVSTVIYTALNVPYSSLNALMTQDPYERSVLSIYRNLLATAGTLIINSSTLSIVEFFGNNAGAWTKTFMVFGVLALVAFLFNYYGTKERVIAVDAEKVEETSLLDGIKALFKNKYWIMITIVLVLMFISWAIQGGATVYFASSILGDSKIAQLLNSVMSLSQIIFMFGIAPLIKKLGKSKSLIVGQIVSIIGLLILVYGGSSEVILYGSSILRGIGNAFAGAVMWAMVSDTVDYGEWVTGLRMEGLTNSGSSFGYKVGNGLGSALLGLILSLGGYVGNATTQTESAIFSINIAFWILPCIISALIVVILSFYKLDSEFSGILADLELRRKQ